MLKAGKHTILMTHKRSFPQEYPINKIKVDGMDNGLISLII